MANENRTPDQKSGQPQKSRQGMHKDEPARQGHEGQHERGGQAASGAGKHAEEQRKGEHRTPQHR
ncbi:hypothetical protein [Hyphomicrobium sp.]|uniref:hypothetical protein n=1 Tax=Hyphomicrobium sp. TaxID=82 RepID=UPI002FDD6701